MKRDEKMRIGFFTDTFLPQTNGVVTSILNFGSELVRRGHEISIFCPKTNFKNYLGMNIHSYRSIIFKPYPEFKIAIPRGKVPKLDIVHTHSPFSLGVFGMKISKEQEIRRVSTFHTVISEYTKYLSKLGKKFLEPITWKGCKLYYNRFHEIIAPSEALKKTLKHQGIKKHITVIPTGIDLEFFRRIDKNIARKKLGIQDKKVFLSLGRLGFEKNIDTILYAFKKVDAKLIIAGRGPAENKLKNLVAELDLKKKVYFRGYVPEELKPLYYSAADVLLTASTSETQAIVIAEAMACGCPVIGTNSLAIPEIIVDGKNGFLFEPGNTEQLSEILRSYEPSEEMQANAIETSKKYSKEKCTDKLEKLYEKLAI